MWQLVDAGLCTRQDLRTTMTIEDYLDAQEYLMKKREEEHRAQQQAQDRAEQRRR